jgi:hypothetical protein
MIANDVTISPLPISSAVLPSGTSAASTNSET